METQEPQYWVMSAGEGAKMWDEFHERGIIGIGWDDLGNLKKYKNQQEIREALKKLYKSEQDPTNDALACFDFEKTIKIGDIVLVKRGIRELVGYGEVLSDYIYDESRKEYRHTREVRWIKKGSRRIPKEVVHPPVKTLTNVTKYGDGKYPQELLNILNKSKNIERAEGLLASKKQIILYGPPGTGKTYITKKIAIAIIN